MNAPRALSGLHRTTTLMLPSPGSVIVTVAAPSLQLGMCGGLGLVAQGKRVENYDVTFSLLFKATATSIVSKHVKTKLAAPRRPLQ